MDFTTAVAGLFIVVSVVGGIIWLFQARESEPEDRPPIRVRNGSIELVADIAGKKNKTGWVDEGNGQYRCRTTNGKHVTTFEIGVVSGDTPCAIKGDRIVFEFEEADGDAYAFTMWHDAAAAGEPHDAVVTIPTGLPVTLHKETLTIGSKNNGKKLRLVAVYEESDPTKKCPQPGKAAPKELRAFQKH